MEQARPRESSCLAVLVQQATHWSARRRWQWSWPFARSLCGCERGGSPDDSGRLNKRLTVAASTEYGLPTASDDEVVLGLLQLTHAGRFADRKLAFVPAELFRVLGWREEGRSYSRLEKSLKRWVGVTLYYDHAWWDKGLKTWMDEHFHLLDNVVIPRSRKKPAKSRDRRQRLPWTVTWNQTVFKSFQDGYLRKLDMTIFRKLRSVAAKRMFRFLDKRFYFTNRLTFDLRLFACERIGFFYIVNHGVSQKVVDDAFRESKRFFDQSESLKQRLLFYDHLL